MIYFVESYTDWIFLLIQETSSYKQKKHLLKEFILTYLQKKPTLGHVLRAFWEWFSDIESLMACALIWAAFSLFKILSVDADLFISSFICIENYEKKVLAQVARGFALELPFQNDEFLAGSHML